ncbi:MAG: hypothetical protein GY940_16680 [bacterium]|nr:hypothetical protein [bacterium]
MQINKKRLIFIFLDGVGIGEPTKENPVCAARVEYLPFYAGGMKLPDGTPVKAIDALLGVGGLPQSASGQSSLYTGENIPELLSKHVSSFPNRKMREVIHQKNILTRLKKKNLDAVFINAYPRHSHLFSGNHLQISPSGEFHFSDDFPPAYKRRISVTTCMMVNAQQTPFDEKDILAGQSIFQDYTNRYLIERGLEMPEFSPEKAAEVLVNASRRRDFILYEFFQTDLYAHRRSFEDRVELLQGLNRLLKKLFSLLDPETDTLLLTSDHGNMEDSSSRSHTRNPVPLIVWGRDSSPLRDRIHSLTDVTPAIVDFFED